MRHGVIGDLAALWWRLRAQGLTAELGRGNGSRGWKV